MIFLQPLNARELVSLKLKEGDLTKLQTKINLLKTLSSKELSKEIGVIGLQSSRRAKKSVVVDKGVLRNSIKAENTGKKSVKVSAGAKYAPYVEYGTGSFVDLEDMKDLGIPSTYAAQFKGKGLRKVNLPARPFFFISINIELKKGLERITRTLNKIVK